MRRVTGRVRGQLAGKCSPARLVPHLGLDGRGTWMANRQLTQEELAQIFAPILKEVRTRLRDASRGDDRLLWALRRKLAKELTYDERGKPMFRRQLKALKRGEQGGRCALCPEPVPDKNAVPDPIEAMLGYTPGNTRLLCPPCDNKVQVERGFA
jgi:hypothetical protein